MVIVIEKTDGLSNEQYYKLQAMVEDMAENIVIDLRIEGDSVGLADGEGDNVIAAANMLVEEVQAMDNL